MKIGSKEAAEILGISHKTIHSYVRYRKIPYYKIGGKLLFDSEEIEALISKSKVDALKKYTPRRSL